MSLGTLQGMYSDLSFFVEMSVGICGLGLLVHTIREVCGRRPLCIVEAP